MEVIHYSGRSTNISLFFNSIITLLLLLVLSASLRRISPKLALGQSELLVIYIMVNISSGIIGHDMMQILVPYLGHAFRFATPENEWKELFWRYIPSWLSVSDKEILRGYYQGESTFYTARHIKGWLNPIVWWSVFISLLLFVMLCINVVLRKQWTETERLSYPIIQLPLEMTNPGSDLFRKKLLWMGFGLAAVIDLINGFSFLFPSIPYIPVKRRNYGYLFVNKPWNAMGALPLSFYPFAIGMGFFIPLDLSFSCWFFFWFWKVMAVVSSALGLRALPRFPYIREQASGGYIALCFIALWLSRNHLWQVILRAIGKPARLDDKNEPMRYRNALLGIGIGIFLIVLFCYKGGMSIWVALVFFGLYFAITTAVARMRAELGTPVHDLHYSGPDEIMVRFMGSRKLNPGNLTMFSLFWFINRAYRSNPMPHQLEGFKMAERTGIENRKLVLAMMLAALIGSLAGFWALLSLGYRLGMETRAPVPAITAFGREPWDRLRNWMFNPSGADYPSATFTIIGFALTILLTMMRMRFFWWPLHPAAFAITTTWGMHLVWSCLFISWLAKLVILRYGGLKTHTTAIPFFLGLILGEFVVGSLWTIISAVSGMETYGFWV